MHWPEGLIPGAIHVSLLPLKAALHYSLPDVRKPMEESKYGRCIVICVFWLAVGAHTSCLSAFIDIHITLWARGDRCCLS